MFRVILGLFLGLIIGMGCRGFDIPLPGPPKIIGALVVLSVTLGYVGMDHLLASRAKMDGAIVRPATTAPYCGGPTGLPPLAGTNGAPFGLRAVRREGQTAPRRVGSSSRLIE